MSQGGHHHTASTRFWSSHQVGHLVHAASIISLGFVLVPRWEREMRSVSCRHAGHLSAPMRHSWRRGACPSANCVSAGGSSMVLAAVLSVLALSSVLLGGGVVLLRGRGMRYFQKG